VCVTAVTLLVVLFSNFSDHNAAFLGGWCFIGLTALNIITNLAIQFFSISKQISKQVVRYFEEKDTKAKAKQF